MFTRRRRSSNSFASIASSNSPTRYQWRDQCADRFVYHVLRQESTFLPPMITAALHVLADALEGLTEENSCSAFILLHENSGEGCRGEGRGTTPRVFTDAIGNCRGHRRQPEVRASEWESGSKKNTASNLVSFLSP